MPGKRKRTTTTTTRRTRRRTNRRRTKTIKVSRNPASRIYYFSRVLFGNPATGADISINNASALNYQFTFQLNQLTSYTDFTGLFDEYRICAMKMTFIPRITGMDGNPTSTIISLPTMVSVLDYDDANTTTFAQCLQYQTMKMTRGCQKHSRYFKPKLPGAVFSGGAAVAGHPTRGWIDLAQPAVPHYGLKIAFDEAFNNGNSLNIAVFTKFYIMFRQVR